MQINHPISLVAKGITANDENRFIYGLPENEPEGTRTPDTRFRKPLLYPTELLVQLIQFYKSKLRHLLYIKSMHNASSI